MNTLQHTFVGQVKLQTTISYVRWTDAETDKWVSLQVELQTIVSHISWTDVYTGKWVLLQVEFAGYHFTHRMDKHRDQHMGCCDRQAAVEA